MYKVRATYLRDAQSWFDLDYYFREHVPLAQRSTAGKLNIHRIEVETDETLLLEPATQRSPCVFCLYFETLEDVEAFRRFLQGPDTDALREDVAHYTNCALEWTVCEVKDG